MHFLARALGCSPQEIGRMELVDFATWLELEQKAQEREAKAEHDKMKALFGKR